MKKGYNIKDLTPAYAIHPGEILQDELESCGINHSDFASSIQMSNSQLAAILEGKQDITEEIANSFEKVLHIDSSLWLSLQRNFHTNLNKTKLRDYKKNNF